MSRWRVGTAAVVVAAAAATAAPGLGDGSPPSGDATRPVPLAEPSASGRPATAPASTVAHPQLAAYRPARPLADVPRPVRLHIPQLGVDSPLDELGRAADRTVQVPSDPLRAGWYAPGPRPGQTGPAVLLGHVDGRRAPGVFSRLRELRPGARVTVERADGSAVRFRVTRLERTSKAAVPTAEVYLPTARAELRLITCGGAFDETSGHYLDNVIAYAQLQT